MSLRLGIDVGGTFTDFVLLDRVTGRLDYHKQPSTPHDPAAAIEAGAAALLAQAGVPPSAVELVVHGTTISLNAILQRRGAPIALVVSPGNRDILEIARVRMADPYGFFALPEAPLAPRDRVLEIGARLDRDGTPVQTPSADDYARTASQLAALGVESVALVLLNAYANPGFEQQVAHELGARLDIPVVASTEIWCEIREYERAMVAVMNAYVTPIMRGYYERLQRNLASLSIVAPVSITTSNGGSVDLGTAYERPIDSTLSGPASGVVAAIETARRAGIDAIVTFDMGGTSADIAVATGDAPEITTRSALGEIPLILPVVNVSAIGAGGGSILRVDRAGFLKVGPTSAGAVPGPACFGQGGADATITDCYLLCGLLDPARFAGGRMALSRDLAARALYEVGSKLGFTGTDIAERAADAALRVASSMMATEMRKMLARRGSGPAEFTLVPYGGAGPTHAALLAEEAGFDRILVAPRPGIFCALGAAVANLRRDFVRSCRLSFDAAGQGSDETQLGSILDALLAEADRWTASVGNRAQGWRVEIATDMRYPDQAFDLTIAAKDFVRGERLARRLASSFHREHARLYDFNEPGSEVEVSRIVLSVIGALPQAPVRAEPGMPSAALPSREIFLNGAWHAAQVMARDALRMTLHGPAIVEQADTTIVVPRGWTASVIEDGSLMLRVAK
ncbi:MAG: hydantoinase/oxoprolinase N-terminal region family protein [Rhodospirillales bacterium]|nr:hydantoinase/oxoprolinase N-terminal region family protein [Rhodospirillales bacterium]